MNKQFVSDFSLFPIKKLGQAGWEYRKATWPATVEQDIHKLYSHEITGPVTYNRQKIRDNTIETCKVLRRDDGKLYMEPGNGFDYSVRIDSVVNQKVDVTIVDESSDEENSNNLQNLECIVCFTNKRTHIIKECSHFLLCQECAAHIFNSTKQCPLCRINIVEPAKKVFF